MVSSSKNATAFFLMLLSTRWFINGLIMSTSYRCSSSSSKSSRSGATASLKNRRAFFGSATATAVATAACLIIQPNAALAEEAIRRQCDDKINGLDASSLNEPSIPYAEFNEKLKNGRVELVEFLAPNGDVAYVTLKGDTTNLEEEASNGVPITATTNSVRLRIGEGYPLEQTDGCSSPLFCIRTVKNAGVPYKFIVKGLNKAV